MAGNYKKTAFRILFLIATPKLTKKAMDLYKQADIPVQYTFHAQGTASSEIMDMLGLDGVDKIITVCMMPRAYADEMISKLQKKLHLGMPNTGIAFSVIMSGSSGRLVQLMETLQPEINRTLLEGENSDMKEREYYMIMAFVNQGYSGEVMEAARPVGASGGTVFHSRQLGSEEAMKFWKISVQQEREVVIILARNEDKLAIMQAIGQKCGMQSEAQGFVLSLPVDDVAGLE
ncbi:MAG: hypothetical protein K2K21_09800 [Lachnospiraceae bacterium]|nr:hypothetical protein [Lachnospiraceae bacterium]